MIFKILQFLFIIGFVISRQFGDMRNFVIFKYFEDRMGIIMFKVVGIRENGSDNFFFLFGSSDATLLGYVFF